MKIKKPFGNAFDKLDFTSKNPDLPAIRSDAGEKKPFTDTRSREERLKDFGIDYINLLTYAVDEEAVKLVNGDIVKKHNCIPIGFVGENSDTLMVVMNDPTDIIAIDDIIRITSMKVKAVGGDVAQIGILIDKHFGKETAKAAAEEYRREFNVEDEARDRADTAEVEDAPVVQLVRGMIEQAVRRRASDIHIEPMESGVRLRYRVDGVLKEITQYDSSLLPVIVSRIKIISGLDISERRSPQDGRATAVVDGDEFDIRVSTLPTVYGEKVVMRLNAKRTMQLQKTRLGLAGTELEKFDEMLSHPHGILLVTGPTGSGKSTTLYTALSELNVEGVNIITVEDPVEVNIAGINQVQVNEKAGLTFATALRSILRQDPDIIMIGEIRDAETAGIAVQAAITGHLVVSTLHTNSTASTVARLVDMGVEPYLAADAVVGIIAQRLIRKLCTCKEGYEASVAEKKELGVKEDQPLTLYKAVGCPKCNGLGYYGRKGVFETMTITNEIQNLIAENGSMQELKNAAVKNGMTTLYGGFKKCVIDGVSSIDEMHRVSYADE